MRSADALICHDPRFGLSQISWRIMLKTGSARVASLSEVTISLEHLRGLDPGTRIVCGYGLEDFTDAERGRLPNKEGPVDPSGSSRVPSTPPTQGAFFGRLPTVDP
jgi:hypothetical protein